MRKIKSFKLFEDFDNEEEYIVSSIRGILIELEDEGMEDEIDTCLVELGDNGFKWITTDWSINKCVMVNIQKDFSYLDDDTRSDYYHKGLHKFNVSDIYESVMLLNDWMFEKYGAVVTYKIYRGNSFSDNDDLNVDDKDSVTEILIKYTW